MELLDWIADNEVLLGILGASSLLMFIGSLIIMPVIVAYMPEDFFLRLDRKFPRKPLRQAGHILKNLVGATLLLAGILMLVLPGQGILTILIGISLLDFPGKAQLQLRMVKLGKVRKSIAWIRKKAGRQPLLLPDGQ